MIAALNINSSARDQATAVGLGPGFEAAQELERSNEIDALLKNPLRTQSTAELSQRRRPEGAIAILGGLPTARNATVDQTLFSPPAARSAQRTVPGCL